MKKPTVTTYISIILFLIFSLIPQIVLGSTYTIKIENLNNPSEINSVTFWFNVDNNFQFLSTDAASTMGNAIPSGGNIGWQATAQGPNQNHIFKIDALDMDDALGIGRQNLLNGTIFSFEYNGNISGFNRIEFGKGSTNLYGSKIFLVSSDAEGVTFSPRVVPIPAAIWLLGSGLLGLWGIQRRRR